MASEVTLEAVTLIIRSLTAGGPPSSALSIAGGCVKLPGDESDAKRALEHELALLLSRGPQLKPGPGFNRNQDLPETPEELFLVDSPFDGASGSPQQTSSSETPQLRNSYRLDDVAVRPKVVDKHRAPTDSYNNHAVKAEESMPYDATMESMAALKEELKKHQQSNEAFQKALREIGDIVTAVARGDLSKKVQIHVDEVDPGIAKFKCTINTMLDQLQMFSSEVSRVAREVGTEGILGGQAQIIGIDGTWKELTENGESFFGSKGCLINEWQST
jgi:osomolarity two-component system, sensor histidine kinase NIK1